jgi:hypothetical protein
MARKSLRIGQIELRAMEIARSIAVEYMHFPLPRWSTTFSTMDHKDTKFREPVIVKQRGLYEDNDVEHKHSYIMESGRLRIAQTSTKLYKRNFNNQGVRKFSMNLGVT